MWRFAAMACALATVLFTATSAHAGWGGGNTYTVNVTTDSAPTTGGAGSGTTGDLRYAITQAEATGSPGNTIQITATGTITLAAALPALAGNGANQLTITGPGAGNLTVSGNDAYTVFTIASATDSISISGLTIANGVGSCSSGNFGGGICNLGATVTVSDSAFLNNSSACGGAIFNEGNLTVVNSTFSGNSSPGYEGGGICSLIGSATVTNSTFYGNSSSLGGAIYIQTGSPLTVTNNIFVSNSGDAIGNNGGTIALESNNVFYNNAGNSYGFTLSSTDVTSKDPRLVALGNYGGPTQTMLPLPGSPAICAGSSSYVPSGVTTDQRGFPLNSSCVDAGAVQTNYVAVTSPSSLSTAIPSGSGAMADLDLTGLTGTVAPGALTVNGQVNIIGSGANNLTISGNNANTVFTINSGATAFLYGLTIANGKGFPDGGGIYNSGTVTVMNSAVVNNTASSTGGGRGTAGGGILNLGALTVMNSTISGNSAMANGILAGTGGGIDNAYATVTVINSTISGNSAMNSTGPLPSPGDGGAIFSNGGTVTVMNSTISSNSAGVDGGILSEDTLNLTNSIVAGNSAPGGWADIDNGGTYNDNGGNVASQNSSGTSTIAIALAPLGYYGGPTQTMPPLTGSPALNAGTYQTGEPTTDQRGAPRPSTSGATIDSGAVQISNEPPTIAAVTPNNGSVNGGTSVTITGTGLDAATAVNFGSTAAAGITLNAGSTSLSTVSATSPAGSVGTVDITVTNSTGTSTTSSSDQFTYWTPVAISPSATTLNGTYGASLNETFTVTGGSGNYTLSNTGTAPAGLTLTPSATGWTLSGTPTVTGGSSLSLTAVDNSYSSNATTQSYTVTVAQATPVITWSAPAAIVYGTPLGTAQLDATTSAPGTFTYTPAAGTVLNAGANQTLAATFVPTSASDYTSQSATTTITVTQASTTTALSAISGTVTPGESITLTAQVQSTAPGAITGNVNFYDGTTLLGMAALNGGSATLTTALTSGITNSLTATYQGNADFAGSSSVTPVSVPIAALDFSMTNGNVSSLTVTGGEPATFSFQITPTYGVYPSAVTFTATGLPQGATATFTPSTIAANGGAQSVSLQIQTSLLMARHEHPFQRGGATLALSCLLLPLLGTRRMRKSRLGRGMVLLLVMAAGAIGLGSLSGCGASPKPVGQNYTITVTATSGSTQHSFNVTLRVQS